MNGPGDPNFNPFPGLRPFQVEEEYLFFGREAQRQELLALLNSHRFVAVVGASGSGKSSLVRAGLLPALFGGVMVGAGSHWNIVIMRPGGAPMRNLAAALREVDFWASEEPPSLLEIETTLTRSGLGLVESVRQARMPGNENLLVVVDQFEELFRFSHSQSERSTRDEAEAFVRLLLEATGQSQHSIYVVLTMRSDFFGDCAQFEDLAEAINKGEYLVPRLNRDQKKQAIEGPLKVGGAKVAPRLLQQLLNDVGDDPDHLPILQHALMRSWDYWRQNRADGEPLDLRHYEAIGGMREALSRHADEVFETLPDQRHRTIAEKVFKALTERGNDNRGIRRPTRLDTLTAITGATDSELRTIIEAFRKQGCTFLMPPQSNALAADTVVDISHESLMRVWQRLRRWVEEEAQSARIYRRLADTAALRAEGRASLYHDPDLQIALTWRDAERPTSAWAQRYHPGFQQAMAFLDESAHAREAEEQAREVARRRELEQARALAEAERRRAEEQARASAWFKRLAGALVVIALLALTAFGAALLARREAQTKAEEARRHAAIAEQERAKADLARARAERDQYFANLTLARDLFENLQLTRAQTVSLEQCPPEHRHWEWGWLQSQLNRDLRTLGGFTNQWNVVAVDFDPTGEWLAACGLFGATIIWDVETGEEFRRFDSHWRSTTLTFSPDGKYLAVGGEADGGIRVLEVAGGEARSPLAAPELGWIESLRFSPDQTVLASGHFDGSVLLWDFQTGRLIRRIVAHDKSVYGLAFHPDGRILATGCGRFNPVRGAADPIKLWDWNTGHQVGTLPGQTDGTLSLDWSSDGTRLAVAGHDNTGAIWDWRSTNRVATLSGAQGSIWRTAFDPSGDKIATASFDGATRIYDAKTGELRVTWQAQKERTFALDLSVDGRFVASGGLDQHVRIWPAVDLPQKFDWQAHSKPAWAAAHSPDGRYLATGGFDNYLRIWDLDARKLTREFKVQFPVIALDWSSDGEQLITPGPRGTVLVWDRSGESNPVRTLSTPTQTVVYSVDLSATDDFVVAGVGDGHLHVWELETGELVRSIAASTNRVNSVTFSPDGKWVAGGSDDSELNLKVWNWREEKLLFGIQAHNEPVTSVAFSPDGGLIATGSLDFSVKLWDVNSGALVNAFLGHVGPIASVRFTPDGARLLSTGGRIGPYPNDQAYSDNTLRLWDVTTGRSLVSLSVSNQLLSAELRPNGTEIAGTAADGRVYVWKAFPWRAEAYGNETAEPFREQLAKFKARYWPEEMAGRTSHQIPGLASAPDASVVPPRDSRLSPRLLDLTEHYTGSLTKALTLGEGSTAGIPIDELSQLAELPLMTSTPFDIRGIIEMRSPNLESTSAPLRIEGIPVGFKCESLHFLQSAMWGLPALRDRQIAKYVIHYADGQQEVVPVIYGKHLMDWFTLDPASASEAKLAWLGINQRSLLLGVQLRFFEQVWRNPRPDIEIARVEIHSEMTRASLMVAAITAR